MRPNPPVLAKERAKAYDTQWDRVYATNLAKRICAIDSEIGAMYFPNTKMVVFHVKNLILHKVMLDKYNSDEASIERHVRHVDKVVRMLKTGLLNAQDIRPANVNWKLGKEI